MRGATADREYDAYFGNDDATPERLRKAAQAGLMAPVVDVYLPSGMPSGAKYRKIETPLEAALRRGWIDTEQKMAGEQFVRHMAGARAQLRYSSSAWMIRVDGGERPDPYLARAQHQTALRQALHTIRVNMRAPFLDWMVKAEQTDTSVAELGENFTPLQHKEAKKSTGITVLQLILTDLAAHFGYITRQSSWQTRQQLEHILRRNQQAFG